jgi:hypothetical protein
MIIYIKNPYSVGYGVVPVVDFDQFRWPQLNDVFWSNFGWRLSTLLKKCRKPQGFGKLINLCINSYMKWQTCPNCHLENWMPTKISRPARLSIPVLHYYSCGLRLLVFCVALPQEKMMGYSNFPCPWPNTNQLTSLVGGVWAIINHYWQFPPLPLCVIFVGLAIRNPVSKLRVGGTGDSSQIIGKLIGLADNLAGKLIANG